jgi:HPt (histidine-containing phosphotransfer) domain-containing protein
MNGTPVRSLFADDEDFAELLVDFVAEAKVKISSFESAWNNRDLPSLKTQSHQLKGSAGGYGFEELSAIAGSFEMACKQGDLDAIAAQLPGLVEYLDRVSL